MTATANITHTAHLDVDRTRGSIVATVDLPAAPQRVFHALASPDVVTWWVRPSWFETREWSGDVRVGGTWSVSGIGRERAFMLEGEFSEVDAPRRLAHSWRASGTPAPAPAPVTTVTYDLEPIGGGTHLVLRHTGFVAPEACDATAAGWQASLDALVQLLAAEHG